MRSAHLLIYCVFCFIAMLIGSPPSTIDFGLTWESFITTAATCTNTITQMRNQWRYAERKNPAHRTRLFCPVNIQGLSRQFLLLCIVVGLNKMVESKASWMFLYIDTVIWLPWILFWTWLAICTYISPLMILKMCSNFQNAYILGSSFSTKSLDSIIGFTTRSRLLLFCNFF